MGVTGDLRLHIDELVLYDFPPHERYRIRDALELELGRLFRERGVPPSLAMEASRPSLDIGEPRLGPGLGGQAIGVTIARRLYERLGADDASRLGAVERGSGSGPRVERVPSPGHAATGADR